MNTVTPQQSAAFPGDKGRIGEFGAVVRDDGGPLIRLPADWAGLTVQRFLLPDNAESGPMFSGMPGLFVSTRGSGKRWYKSGVYVRELLTGPFVDTYSATFERDRAQWRGEAGESIGIRVPPNAARRLMHNEMTQLDLKMQFNVVDKYLGNLARQFADEMEQELPNGRLFAEGLSLTILGWLTKHYMVTPAAPPPRRRLSESHKSVICNYIDAHIGEDLSVVQLAVLLGISPNHFARVFKATFCVSPHQFLLKRRIELASERLKTDSEQSIAQIALAFGFVSQAHFTDVFRRVIGETPARWRSYQNGRRAFPK